MLMLLSLPHPRGAMVSSAAAIPNFKRLNLFMKTSSDWNEDFGSATVMP
jgi:hypothetical protein